MKWVTRENAAVDRIACPWLIRRFVDPEAEFLFVPADQVTRVAREVGATPFDVPRATLGHVDGRCSFESILVAYGLDHVPELLVMARVIHAADIPDDAGAPEGAGLRAIAEGFRLLHGRDDRRKLELEAPMYDALHAWAQGVAAAASKTGSSDLEGAAPPPPTPTPSDPALPGRRGDSHA